MSNSVYGFEYKDGVWKAAWHTLKGRKLKILLIGDADIVQSQSALIQVRRLLNDIDEYIDKASAYACNSEYRDDVSSAGGMLIDSVVIIERDDTIERDDIKVWFTVGESDRMIGVRMQEGKPVDVFCDA